MPSIAGLLRLDGRSQSELDVVPLLGPVVHGTAQPRAWHAAQLAIASVRLAGESDDGLAVQPLGDGHCASLLFDGRLDNRPDLLCRRNASRSHPLSDADLVLAHLTRFGPRALRDILGDWSLAAWLPSTRTIVLASDFMGVRPLYYRRCSEAFAWSSSIEALVDLEPTRLNFDYLLGELTFNAPRNATPYDSIHSVAPGTYLEVDRDGRVTSHEYWAFEHCTLRCASESAYADQLRHLLTEAVQVRLSSPSRTWILLSGGYDSSSIFCLADPLVSAGLTPTPSLRAASWVSRTSIESDESRFVDAVVEGTPWPVDRIYLEDHRESTYTRTTPFPVPGVLREVAKRMQEDGASTLLSGRLGDTVMANYRDYSHSLATHLYETAPLKFMSEAHAWAAILRQTIWQVCGKALVPTLPVRWRRQYRLRRTAAERRATSASANALARLFCIPRHLGERVRELFPDIDIPLNGWPDPGRRHVLGSIYMYQTWRLLQSPESLPHIRLTYPFSHRPLVEFALAVPHAFLCRPGERRVGMKAALRDVLPARILQRTGKGYPEPALIRDFHDRALWLQQHVGHLRLVSLGLIDPDALAADVRHFLAGSTSSVFRIRDVLRVEGWLAFLDSSSRPTRTPATSLTDERHRRKEVTHHDVRSA